MTELLCWWSSQAARTAAYKSARPSMIDQLTARGVHFTRYEGMGQDERGVWTAPGGAKIAWFLDPDGNNLSLTEFEASE